MRMRRLSYVLLLLSLGGCYSYAPIAPESAPVGSRVRARLSAAEAERLSEVLGRDERVLEGTVVPGAQAGILLEVPSAVTTEGSGVNWLSQRVEITPTNLIELELRRIDRVRTAAVALVIGVVAGYAVQEAFSASGDPSGAGPKPGTDRYLGLRFPIAR